MCVLISVCSSSVAFRRLIVVRKEFLDARQGRLPGAEARSTDRNDDTTLNSLASCLPAQNPWQHATR